MTPSLSGVTQSRGDKIVIGCASNSLYFPGLAVALHAVLRNHCGDSYFEIHIFETAVSDKDKARLVSVLKQSGREVSVHYIAFDPQRFSSVPRVGYITKETYARLLLPELLPDVDRILYLDCDLVILSDVARLWAIDVSGHSGAMCRDAVIYLRNSISLTYAALGLRPDMIACNCGLMLINLDYWRKNDISRKVMMYLEHHADTLRAADQDGINAVLAGTWIELDPRWNAMVATLLRRANWSPEVAEFYTTRIRQMEKDPWGVHYTGPKPWIDGKPSLWAHHFWREAELSGWYADTWISLERVKCFFRFLGRILRRTF